MHTFSFESPINLTEEREALLAVMKFEATNSVFDITDEEDSFSISTLEHCTSKGSEETIHKLKKILELRSQVYIESHVKEVEKIGLKIVKEYFLSKVDTFEKKIEE